MIITHILKDDFNRKFYTQTQTTQSFARFIEQVSRYTRQLYNSISK